MLITSQAIQTEMHFDLTKCENYNDFASIVTSLLEKSTASPDSKVNYIYYPHTYPWLSNIDFTNSEQIHSFAKDETIKKFFENYKATFYNQQLIDYANLKCCEIFFSENFINRTEYVGELLNGISDLDSCYKKIETVNNPIIAPWRDPAGNIQAHWESSVAISQKSKNKVNAYNFIKILLSKEIQLIPNNGSTMFHYPISNVAAKEYIRNCFLSKEAMSTKHAKKDQRTTLVNNMDSYLSEICATNIDWTYYKDIEESLTPYFKGTKSYEECIKDVESKMQAYALK